MRMLKKILILPNDVLLLFWIDKLRKKKLSHGLQFRIVNKKKRCGIRTKRGRTRKFTKILFLPVIDRRIDRSSTAIISAIIIGGWTTDGPTLRESILGNRGIREKGARRGQRRGKRRRRRGRPRTKGRILPCGPFPPPISRWTFSAVTVHGYWLLLANFFSPPHGNRAAVSNHFRVY